MHNKCSKKGLTLVEIILSFAALMLLVSIFAGSIAFSNRMMQHSMDIRAKSGEAALLLRENTTPETLDDVTYSFSVVGGTGENVLFEVDAARIRRTVTLSDGTTCTFYQFAPKGGA